ncbi:MAG: ABC transporter permease [Bacteroidota bacterium]|nr:ABC transporter permease [Bacteroidota bacterium]MDP4211984.1 ABC transporter permease [Bacteroidota bacterium]
MIKNYLLVAIRNLRRNKVFSSINLMGLTIGMASAMLILLWIQNELSYDRFHEKKDRLYEIYNRDKFNGKIWAWDYTPKVLAPTLKKDFPQVEDAVRMRNANFLFNVGDRHFNLAGNFTDSGFLNMFSFPLLKGNPDLALRGNGHIVLTETTARKLFGKEDPMGKVVRVDSADQFIVTGVLKDLPNNTRFNFEYLLPWTYMQELGWDDNYWVNNSVQTYITLKPGVTETAFDARVRNITIDHSREGAIKSDAQVFLHPADKWHLYSKFENGRIAGGQIETVRLFAIIAAFILLIACINFMNLSTARSEKRAKEVGIRKVVGAAKAKLIGQFLGESVLIALLAGIAAVLIVQLSLGPFNLLVNKELFIDFSSPYFWISGLGFILLTGLIAGSYPAFYLSSFKPVKVLKGSFKTAHALVKPRKMLVVLQFTFAIMLIISTIIVERQIEYAQNRDSGYSKDNLFYSFMQGAMQNNFEQIRNDLLSSGAATGVTRTTGTMVSRSSDTWGIQWSGATEADKKLDFNLLGTDDAFAKNMGLKLVQGRDINARLYITDSSAMLLNESAAKVMRFKDPIGEIVRFNEQNFHVVGVIKDFILESPYEPITPMLITGPNRYGFYVLNVKLNPAHTVAENLVRAEQIFKKYNPAYPFEYHFVDEEYAAKFADEKRTGKLAALFAGLTIFISCLGLFGLATYTAENRIKEIGVRKVLGASVTGITALLSKDFLKLVILSIIIASPLAWWAMNTWLKAFPYRIKMEWWVFAAAGILSVLIGMATVGFQSIKAALANPVKSLRSE